MFAVNKATRGCLGQPKIRQTRCGPVGALKKALRHRTHMRVKKGMPRIGADFLGGILHLALICTPRYRTVYFSSTALWRTAVKYAARGLDLKR